MIAALIALSVLLLAAAGACAWLAVERARQTARAADAQRVRDVALADLAGAERTVQDLRAAIDRHGAELREARECLGEAEIGAARLTERLRALEQRENELTERFQSLADKMLQQSVKELRTQTAAEIDQRRAAVDALVRPIAETLKKTDEKLVALEKERAAADAALREQVRSLTDRSQSLSDQTGKLVQALRRPEVRGRYGEIQLQRVVELAGLRAYCDFDTQSSTRDNEDRLLRPDMVVRLPNGRSVAVDAKTNIDAYISAVEAPERAQQDVLLEKFADHVAQQAERLSGKQYAASIGGSLDFVVMFIPGDQFIDAALQRRPQLLDLAAQKGIVLASPSTLIGLLRAVHVGWRERSLGEQAEELFKLGRELHERASVALGHADKLGRSLGAAIESYNAFVGSVDSRLVPTLRKFEEAGAKGARELPEPASVDVTTRPITSLDGGVRAPE